VLKGIAVTLVGAAGSGAAAHVLNGAVGALFDGHVGPVMAAVAGRVPGGLSATAASLVLNGERLVEATVAGVKKGLETSQPK
jgi:hypothetical protein